MVAPLSLKNRKRDLCISKFLELHHSSVILFGFLEEKKKVVAYVSMASQFVVVVEIRRTKQYLNGLK